ncbi:hypothetical protein [Pseudomonas sp. BW16M2]|uniref:hypothetical protein n=1 Tax=Pseudomonas sp. BW16M2 TaxID=2745489 RepID=UPI001676CE4E|nr:hypothetical protein [Pseudomonas sp. BW16M2]
MISELSVHVLFRSLCYPLGWPLVKLATLGRYPSRGAWYAERAESEWTAAIGLVVLLLLLMLLLGQFNVAPFP